MNHQNKTRFIDTENKLEIIRGEGGWGWWVKWAKGVIYMVMDDNWTYCGDQFVVYTDIVLLSCTPQIDIMLCTSLTQFKKES